MQELFKTAFDLHRQGRLVEAQHLYLQVLANEPDHADALHFLGIVRRQQGRYGEAVELLARAVALRPKEPVFHGNLGNALRDKGDVEAAVQSYRRAIAINPAFVDAHNNLGVLWLRHRKITAATDCFKVALALNPDHVDAINNLGFAHKESGQLGAATACYERAIELQPTHQGARYNLANVALYQNDLALARNLFGQAEDLGPRSSTGLGCAVRQGLISFLMDDHEQAHAALSRAQALLLPEHAQAGSAAIYQSYLTSLVGWWRTGALDGGPASDVLHVIGESHALSAHGALIGVDGKPHRCQSWWIEGCKQWHLARAEPSRFKAQFDNVMAHLPERSAVMLTIGEIDCRLHEGVLQAWRKNPGRALEDWIADTVNGFVAYATASAAQHGHRLVISGVPASNVSRVNLAAEDIAALAELIRVFNTRLKAVCALGGHRYLDVYALTVNAEGFGNGRWHIDAHHLRPDAWAAVSLI